LGHTEFSRSIPDQLNAVREPQTPMSSGVSLVQVG
jgi:hypothetical protein